MSGLRQDSSLNNCPVTANGEFIGSGHPYQPYGGGGGSFYATNPAFPGGIVPPQYPPRRPQQMQQVYQTVNEQNTLLSYERDVHQYGFNEYPPFHGYPDGIDPRTRTYSIHSSGSTSTINTTCSSNGSSSSPHIHRIPGPYMDSFYSNSSYPAYSPPTISPDARFNGSEQFFLGDTYNVPVTNYGGYQLVSSSSIRNPSSHPIPIPPSTVRHSGTLIHSSSHDTYPVQSHHHPQNQPPQAQPSSPADERHALPPPIIAPTLPFVPAQQQSQDLHPFSSEHNGDRSFLNRPRRPWPSKFEEQVFTPEDMRLPAVKRRRIYINSLEQHCNQIHSLLKAHGLLTAPSPQHIQDIVSTAAPQTSGNGKRPPKRAQNTKLTLIKIQHEMDALRTRLGSLTESLCKQSSSPETLAVLPNTALSPHPFSTTNVS